MSSIDPLEEALLEYTRQNVGRRLLSERELALRFDVSRAKLRKVLRTMQAAGLIESRQGSGAYAVDPTAPRLRTIAILVDEELKLGDDPFFTLLFERLQRAAQEAGMQSLVYRIGTGSIPASYLHDGAITLGRAGAEIANGYATHTIPMVALMPGSKVNAAGRVSVVQLADTEAGAEAAQTLIAQGCRTILFAGKGDIDASRDRFAGASQACESAGVPIRILYISLNYAAGIATGRTLDIKRLDRAGLIATNDWLAAGIRSGLAQQGGPVLPIVSFDGLPLAAEPSLAIQSLKVPIDDIADDAIAELGRLHRSQAPSARLLTYRLTR